MTDTIKKRSNLRQRAGIFRELYQRVAYFVTDAEPTSPPIRRYATEDLFQGSKEVAIIHNGEHYRLRITARGKLILTK